LKKKTIVVFFFNGKISPLGEPLKKKKKKKKKKKFIDVLIRIFFLK